MSEKPLPELTANELAILKVLWSHGHLSAREIHDQLSKKRAWSNSTTRTFLARLVAKDLLSKKRFHGILLYEPTISKAKGLAHMVRHFAENVVEMELAPVVNLFTGSAALTDGELKELHSLLHVDDEDQKP